MVVSLRKVDISHTTGHQGRSQGRGGNDSRHLPEAQLGPQVDPKGPHGLSFWLTRVVRYSSTKEK